jgi:hypothetical protein
LEGEKAKAGLPSDFREREAFKMGPRTSKGDMDDDDDDDDGDATAPGKQRIGLFEDAISLDQVSSCADTQFVVRVQSSLHLVSPYQARRIAQQSIWRMRA